MEGGASCAPWRLVVDRSESDARPGKLRRISRTEVAKKARKPDKAMPETVFLDNCTGMVVAGLMESGEVGTRTEYSCLDDPMKGGQLGQKTLR
jgi:hypothetical protein